jgi:4,5-DOPA dioxygenase extradiol
MLPTVFISHGSPMTIAEDSPARRFLESLGGLLPRPAAILSVSAHWETEAPMVSDPPENQTIHDFYGFPPPLYALRYTPPVAHGLAARVAALLAGAGLPCKMDKTRGLDHGSWVPLMLAYPAAEIPVIQLSVQTQLGAAHHLALGAALAPLRAEGVLVLGTGSFTHDLRRFRAGRLAADAAETPDVTQFSQWMDEKIMPGDVAALASYRRLAPYAMAQHPREEHLLALHEALAAAGPGAPARRLHSSVEYGFLRMDAYAFG